MAYHGADARVPRTNQGLDENDSCGKVFYCRTIREHEG